MKYETPLMVIKKFEVEEFVVASSVIPTETETSSTAFSFNPDDNVDSIFF